MRDKFLKHDIPYDDLDVEMIELLDVLNFHLGFTTKFCCYGHNDWTRTYVIFHESVTDEQIYSLAEVVAIDWKNHINFNKWVRGLNGKIASNWILKFSKLWKDPNDVNKREHLDKVVRLLKSV